MRGLTSYQTCQRSVTYAARQYDSVCAEEPNCGAAVAMLAVTERGKFEMESMRDNAENESFSALDGVWLRRDL